MQIKNDNGENGWLGKRNCLKKIYLSKFYEEHNTFWVAFVCFIILDMFSFSMLKHLLGPKIVVFFVVFSGMFAIINCLLIFIYVFFFERSNN